MPKQTATRSLKPSTKLLLGCLIFGLIVAGGLNYFLPGMTWWGYPIVAFGVACVLYGPLLRQLADEKTLDG